MVFFWKRRNIVLHEGTYSTMMVIWDINNTLRNFMKWKFGYTEISRNWPHIVALLEVYKPILKTNLVRWSAPPRGW